MLDVAEKGKGLSQRRFLSRVKRGFIKRPRICQKCAKRTKNIKGHHTDYNKPYDVEWLCPQCHSDIHNDPLQHSMIKQVVNLSDIEKFDKSRITKTVPARCPEKLKEMLNFKGLSFSQWCKARGFNRNNIYEHFAGKLPATTGKIRLAIDALNVEFPGWNMKNEHTVYPQLECGNCGHKYYPRSEKTAVCPRCHVRIKRLQHRRMSKTTDLPAAV